MQSFQRLAASAMVALAFVSPSAVHADAPDSLRIAIVIGNGPESAWDGTLLEAMDRVVDEAPHGLDITYRVSDPLWGDDVENAMRLYAQSGQFDIIWGHSTYSDQIRPLMDEFPDVLFTMTGSGNEPLGENVYWIYKRVHEPAYMLGVLAGAATESNIIGTVGTMPADDVNDEINAFFAGARSVNPDVSTRLAFIQSWYDPATAAEFMNAQIAAGADVLFTLVDNFAPCDENAGEVVCIGNFRDDTDRSEQLISAPLALWDPDIMRVIDAWYDFKANGTPLAGNTDMLWVSMRDGGAGVAPIEDRASLVPADALAAFEQAMEAFANSELDVPLDTSLPVGD